ncbi:MAG: tryptophan synthase subunit alpha [Chloroflexi bacterium]|jgi:tryptophan synthase alpha chain|nr:tryptophan synthase subunit alpha [Chloroflexota bacterium]MBT4074076.1 tryptophan synthase subunit alpha [Chloroflexota bacterium]MBT4514077.1 tryptophan synthase subunit alpha [Chloroflexota bacterium]MBT6681877.1 tryptophan synthase subunit alpha [Chloroflexota bacterium]
MSERLDSALRRAKDEGRTAIAPFVTVGYPSVKATLEIVPELEAAGADLIELGVPFSDPLAEGPTIQKSSQHALEQGVSSETAMSVARQLRASGVTIPMVFMGYYNPVLSYDPERYCKDAAGAGIDGMIVPDLPTEENSGLSALAEKYGLSLIPLVAMTSPDHRIKNACLGATGFIYCVGTLGVTGVAKTAFDRVHALVDEVRNHADIPVGVGFGIRTGDDVRKVAEFADIAIVGSALVDVIGDGPADGSAERAGALVRELAAAARAS